MALKFRLRGLAETFIDKVECPKCHTIGTDDEHFSTELSRVTFEGIVVVCQCRSCGEIFVPTAQRLGVVNSRRLHGAVERDSNDTGEPLMAALNDVVFHVEQLNASRKGDLH